MSFQWTIKQRLELKMKIYFVYVFWLNSQLGQVRQEGDGGGISSRDCRIAINFLLHTTTSKKKLQLSFPFFFSLSLSHVSTSSLLLAVSIFKMSPTICHCKFFFPLFHMALEERELAVFSLIQFKEEIHSESFNPLPLMLTFIHINVYIILNGTKFNLYGAI